MNEQHQLTGYRSSLPSWSSRRCLGGIIKLSLFFQLYVHLFALGGATDLPDVDRMAAWAFNLVNDSCFGAISIFTVKTNDALLRETCSVIMSILDQLSSDVVVRMLTKTISSCSWARTGSDRSKFYVFYAALWLNSPACIRYFTTENLFTALLPDFYCGSG